MSEKYPILDNFYFKPQLLWAIMPVDAWNDLTSNSTMINYSKDTIIIYEGEFIPGIYIVRSGIIKVYNLDPKGNEQITFFLCHNYVIGYNTALTTGQTFAYVTALTDCTLELIPMESFKRVLKKSLEMNTFLLTYSGHMYRMMNNKLTAFAHKPVNERVVLGLLILNEQLNLNDKIILSREDLANYIGTAKESLIRQLKILKDKGIIEVTGRIIRLVNKDALYALATGQKPNT